VHLLEQPHHDGSPDYVGPEWPRAGRFVTVRIRTSARDDVERVWLRSTPDGEPHFAEATATCGDRWTVWWTMRLQLRNAVQRYRFLLAGLCGRRWLNAAGTHRREVPDADDFVLVTYDHGPDWARDAIVYQIFPDRYARSDAADTRPLPSWARRAHWDERVLYRRPGPRSRQLFGGDLDGIREHLDHIEELGADVVYLTPIFPAGSSHRYDAMGFDEIDPVLGGNAALVRLSRAVHRRRMRLVGDLTTNHTGREHPWFKAAFADPHSPFRPLYFFHGDSSRYEGWLGVKSLPKLNYADDFALARMVTDPDSPTRAWLRPPYRLDGWRIDVANMTGRHALDDLAHRVAAAIRTAAVETRRESLVIAEHTSDATIDLNRDGWHGTMNYAGFAKPWCSWLMTSDLDFHRLPVGVGRADGEQVVVTVDDYGAKYGWTARTMSWNLLGSHDTPRIRTVAGRELHAVGAGIVMTMPGTPMIFAGDEIGLEGISGEDARRTMPWHDRSRWDFEMFSTYQELIALRRTHRALVAGSLRWVHVAPDVVAYLRELAGERLLCVASRASANPFDIPRDALGAVRGTCVYGNAGQLHAGSGAIRVDVDAPGFRVWQLA
jgi:alpha-glucosidase